MDRDNYFTDTTRLSRSMLLKYNTSPYSFYKHYVAPSEPQADTAAMKYGRAFHMLLNEPDLFWEQYALAPDVDRRYTDGKEKYNKFIETLGNKTEVSQSDYNRMSIMRSHVVESKAWRKIFSAQGAVEKVYQFEHPITGIACKMILDKELDDLILEVKTCTDASPKGFRNFANRYFLSVQDSMYMDGIVWAGEARKKAFVFCMVEKTYPYHVEYYTLSASDKNDGRRIRDESMDGIKKCYETGIWPGYNNNPITEINLNLW